MPVTQERLGIWVARGFRAEDHLRAAVGRQHLHVKHAVLEHQFAQQLRARLESDVLGANARLAQEAPQVGDRLVSVRVNVREDRLERGVSAARVSHRFSPL